MESSCKIHSKEYNQVTLVNQKLDVNSDYTTELGQLQKVTPWLRRITAPNPGPYTFRGTGTYVVGEGEVAVIDPGPPIKSHVDALLEALGAERVSHILVTHAHQDHSPACELLQQIVDAPIYAFAQDRAIAEQNCRVASAGFDEDFRPDVELADGEKVTGKGWTLTALHTPGHTSDHLCFSIEEYNELFTGDHVMGWSTSIISPPDGNMGDYMRSLQRLLERDETRYWPTHGAPISSPRTFVQSLIEHRHQREAAVLRCVKSGHTTIDDMVPIIYADVDAKLYGAAERSLLACVEWLVENDKLQEKRDGSGVINYTL